MPGYEPFLLCDFHVRTTWSDGCLSVREAMELYGQTGRFDVVAITDRILTARGWLGRDPTTSLGPTYHSVTEDRFERYISEIKEEAARAKDLYGLLVIPGAEITQHHRGKADAHIVALNLTEFIGADDDARVILKEIRRQGGLSIGCHPHHRATRRIAISRHRWDNRKNLADLVDVWEAETVAGSDVQSREHLSSWKMLLRSEKNWEAVACALRANDLALTLYRGAPRAA